MARWHHRCNEHKLGQTSGDGEGRGLACCSPWGLKESDMTEQLSTVHTHTHTHTHTHKVLVLTNIHIYIIYNHEHTHSLSKPQSRSRIFHHLKEFYHVPLL